MKPAVFFLLAITTLLLVQESMQNCCYSNFFSQTCDDGTPATPCCGYGQCNAFCCGCDGGCRGSGWGAMGLKSSSKPSGYTLIDTDGSGTVSFEEAKAHLGSGRCGNGTFDEQTLLKTFSGMDLDEDGLLNEKEINM